MVVEGPWIHHDAHDELRPGLGDAHERRSARGRGRRLSGRPRQARGAEEGRRGERQRREVADGQGTTTTPGGSKVVLLLASTKSAFVKPRAVTPP